MFVIQEIPYLIPPYINSNVLFSIYQWKHSSQRYDTYTKARIISIHSLSEKY